MNKIVATKFIPRLGNGRPENGTVMPGQSVVAAAGTGGRISINSKFSAAGDGGSYNEELKRTKCQLGAQGRALCSGRSRFLRFLFRAAGLPALFFRFARFLLRCLIDLLIEENGGIYPLQIGDRSCVAFALPQFHNSGVTAVAIGRARRDFFEQLFHSVFLPQNRESSATGMD
jgi:hypothetical protein